MVSFVWSGPTRNVKEGEWTILLGPMMEKSDGSAGSLSLQCGFIC